MSDAVPVTFVLPDLGAGGAQRVMLRLAGGLDPARFAAHLIMIGQANDFAGDVPLNVTSERLNAKGLRYALPSLVRSIRAARPRILITTMGYMNLGLLALRPLLGRGLDIVVREANVVEASVRALPRWLPGRRLYAKLYPRAAAVLAQTNAIAAELARVVPNAGDRIVIFPNPVDEKQHRGCVASAIRPRGSGLVLAAAGRLTRQKGFDRLVEIFSQLPRDARLTIYGEGPDRSALEAQIRALGLQGRVSLPGFSSDLATAIASADFFLLPSRWEGLPNVALESLALGTPVIASDESGVDDVAKLAPDAVTIANVESAFAHVIASQSPAAGQVALPRPSLLPPEYRIENVTEQFSNLLDRIVQSRP